MAKTDGLWLDSLINRHVTDVLDDHVVDAQKSSPMATDSDSADMPKLSPATSTGSPAVLGKFRADTPEITGPEKNHEVMSA